MTTMTTTFTPAGRTIAPAGRTEAPHLGDPNFHVGSGARLMLAFAGLMVPLATALYVYGQVAPGT